MLLLSLERGGRGSERPPLQIAPLLVLSGRERGPLTWVCPEREREREGATVFLPLLSPSFLRPSAPRQNKNRVDSSKFANFQQFSKVEFYPFITAS